MEQGSEEWFGAIASLLKDQLLGIELHDYTGQGGTPPVQVTFIIPAHFDKVGYPAEVGLIAGYHASHFYFRGDNRLVDGVLFNFYPPLRAPSKKILEKVAREFGLTIRKPEAWGEHHFGLYSPRLYEPD